MNTFKGRPSVAFSAKILLVLLIAPVFPQKSSASVPTSRIKSKPFYYTHWKGYTPPPPVQTGRVVPTSSQDGVVMLQPLNHHGYYHHQNQQIALPPPPQPPPRQFVPFKFKPMTKKQGVMLPQKCEGRKNLLNDIGIISLITAIASSTFGMYTIIFNSITSNNIGIVSGVLSLVLWLPSTLITFFNLSGTFIYNLSNWLNGASFFNALFGLVGVWYGTWDVITSVLGETVGLTSLALSIIATFPDFLDELIEVAYTVGNKRRLEFYVENYGCRVPGLFTVMGRHLYDILDRLLVNSTKQVAAAVQKTF